MKGKRGGPPSNIIRLRMSPPRPPSAAAVLAGLQLLNIFLKIGSEQDRKRVLDLAKQLAPIDAGTKT
jgi:hypothetical protein